jgi:hypothetical protein
MDISFKALEEALGIRREIERLERQLAAIFGNSALPSSAVKGRRGMSAATRAKIAAAARARWAKRKAGQTVSKPAKKKGGITLAGRRKLSQMMKARWAARRKAGNAVSKPAKKKGGLTPAGRRKLSQLMKARWAARRRAKRKK